MLGFTKEQAHERFGFLLDAFKYGVPPHAGLAYGLDRLVMLMAKEDSIRDVIAFPKVKDASCLMTEAPSPVDAAQLEELGLEVEPQAEEEVQRCLSFFRFHSIGVKKNLRNSSTSSPLFCWKKVLQYGL